MTLDYNFWAITIALLAFSSAVYLAQRARHQHEPMIWSAVIPRLYIAAMYVWFTVGDTEIDERLSFVRAGLIVLFVVENLNHFLSERRPRT